MILINSDRTKNNGNVEHTQNRILTRKNLNFHYQCQVCHIKQSPLSELSESLLNRKKQHTVNTFICLNRTYKWGWDVQSTVCLIAKTFKSNIRVFLK